MAEPMYPIIQPPAPTSTSAFPFLLSKNALEASRTEILVLASGILFLASQVCLLVWMLRRTGAAPPRKDQRKVAIILPAETEDPSPGTDDALEDVAIPTIASGSDDKHDSPLRLRHSSSWGGRSALPSSHDPQERRRSAGWLSKAQDSDDDDEHDEEEGKVGAQTLLSSCLSLGSKLATPTTLQLSSTIGDESNGINDGGAEDTELREFNAQPAWGGEPGLPEAVTPPIEKPPSPRSPRVLAADQAAIIDALCAEGDPPSPVAGAEVDAPALAFGFEDPLGVNRLVDLPQKDEQGHEAVELEWRDGERRDV